MSVASIFHSPLQDQASMLTTSGKVMEKSGDGCTQGWVIQPKIWTDAWRQMYPVKPAQCVAERINAPLKTVEKWFAGDSRPSFDWWGPILNAYGLSFVVAGMARPAPWLDDMAREEQRARLLAKREVIDAQLAEISARRLG